MTSSTSEIDEYLALWRDEYISGRRAGLKHTRAKRLASDQLRRAYPELADLMRDGMVAKLSGSVTPETEKAVSLVSRMGQIGRHVRKIMDDEMAAPPAGLHVIPMAALPGLAPIDAPYIPNTRPTIPPRAANPTQGPPGPNGDRQKPGIVLYPSGYSRVNETVLVMVLAAAPTPGKTFCVGNLSALNALIGCSQWAVPNVLLGNAGNTTMSDAGYEFAAIRRDGDGYVEGCFSVRCVRAPRTAAAIEADAIRAEMAEMAAKQKELETRLRGLGL